MGLVSQLSKWLLNLTLFPSIGRNMGGYAIETSFCGAKPIVNPSTYDLSGQSDDRSTPPQRINQSEESLTGNK